MRNPLLATTCACLLGTLATACGGDSTTPAPSAPPDSGGASGSPRLSWDQSAPGAEELRRYSFVLYVDGTPIPLPGAACGALAPDSQTAPCNSPLPALTSGEHTLEMATRLTRDGNVIESARSAPVLYTAGASGFGSETAGARTPSSQGDVAALPRYVVEPVVGGLDEPSALAQLPDGRLLIAERGGRIRIAEGGVPRPEPAAELPGADPAAGARVSLAVAPDFEANRHVFVSYARLDADGTRTGRVVRLREVRGSLGEPAVIVDDLPAEPDAPGLRIGRDGKLYVATSAAAGQDAPDLGSYAGKVLRFQLDGRAASADPNGSSPVFSFGYRGRLDFDWEPASANLWYLEADGTRLILGRSEAGRSTAPVADLGEARAAGVAFYAGGTFAEWQGSLFVALPGQECLLRVSGLEASPPQPALERLALGVGRVLAVLPAADGLYVAAAATGPDSTGQRSGAVYRIRRSTTGK